MKLIDKLQKLRDRLGPINIISGYRSIEHNKNIGGAKKSSHCTGKACDFKKVSGITDAEFKKLAIELGFTGIGLYNTFWHVDVRVNPPSRGFAYWDMRKK